LIFFSIRVWHGCWLNPKPSSLFHYVWYLVISCYHLFHLSKLLETTSYGLLLSMYVGSTHGSQHLDLSYGTILLLITQPFIHIWFLSATDQRAPVSHVHKRPILYVLRRKLQRVDNKITFYRIILIFVWLYQVLND